VQALSPEVLQHVLLDLPGLLFFTTYTLLVLFWAEIYYQVQPCNLVKTMFVYVEVVMAKLVAVTCV
jgi:hypothetical protein